MFDLMEFISKVFLFYLPLLFSLCVHEFAHAWTAKKLGDLTAFQKGRLTLNPVAHIDPIGTLILPLVAIGMNFPIFGWAKPVPVDPSYLKNQKRDMFWIAFAGPLSNFLLAGLGCLTLAGLYTLGQDNIPSGPAVMSLGEMFIYINLLLGFFNLIPLHPLDGGKVIARFLPVQWNIFLEKHQSWSSLLLILLFISGGFYFLAGPVFYTARSLIHFAHFFSQWIG
ncbi:MAG: site-2 protease family protein [Bdellovibrionales bacterium]|nr:site-2 protease family protein [Bdellovibrionales bacterium]